MIKKLEITIGLIFLIGGSIMLFSRVPELGLVVAGWLAFSTGIKREEKNAKRRNNF